MIGEALIKAFTLAARALSTGAKDSGYTSNGLRKLDFKIGNKIFTAVEQNPNKLSLPAQLKRSGHDIIQIRDDSTNTLLGNVDVTENRFNSYDATPNPVEIDEIVKALPREAVEAADHVRIAPANTSGSGTGRPAGELSGLDKVA